VRVLSEDVESDRHYARRVLIAVGIIVLAVLLAYLLQYVGFVLLLGFAGILLAIGFDGLADLVYQRTPLTRGWSLTLVFIGLVVLMGTLFGSLGPLVVDQMTELAQRLPNAINNLQSYVETYPWGRMLLRNVPGPQEILANSSSVLRHVMGAFSTAFGALANVLLILVLGIYIAVHPSLYTNSAVYLLPRHRRARAQEVLAALGHAMRRWFAGRLASMAMVGVLTYIGLSIVGVPLSLALGVITAILEFVPYLGPILALIPAVLVALLESPILVLYVLPLYALMQLAESYLITPLIEKRAVSIPPAYLIFVQVLGGVLAGFIGVVLAEPLAVVTAILVQMLYIEDLLGDSVRVMGERPAKELGVRQTREARRSAS
jgi:predicted PurR-regulated permease PerM